MASPSLSLSNLLNNLDAPKWFWAQVNITANPDKCWEWQGTRTRYGGFKRNRTQYLAHRVAYALFYRVDPVGLLVCHKCDNPPCCNPYHLFLGTHRDNTEDARRKGRIFPHCSTPSAILADEQVMEIMQRVADGEAKNALAKEYRVSRRMVQHICAGTIYKHLPRPRVSLLGNQAKLTAKDVQEIKFHLTDGMPIKELAVRYSVGCTTIQNIKNGVSWKDVANYE